MRAAVECTSSRSFSPRARNFPVLVGCNKGTGQRKEVKMHKLILSVQIKAKYDVAVLKKTAAVTKSQLTIQPLAGRSYPSKSQRPRRSGKLNPPVFGAVIVIFGAGNVLLAAS